MTKSIILHLVSINTTVYLTRCERKCSQLCRTLTPHMDFFTVQYSDVMYAISHTRLLLFPRAMLKRSGSVGTSRAKDSDSLDKVMKERMRVDLELSYSDTYLDQLLSITSFLHPKLMLVIEMSILQKAKNQLSEVETDSAAGADTPPAAKKAKGLSETLGKCLPGTTTCINWFNTARKD